MLRENAERIAELLGNAWGDGHPVTIHGQSDDPEWADYWIGVDVPPLGPEYDCPVCDGAGEIEMDDDEELEDCTVCDVCRGSGRVTVMAARRGGEG